MSRYTQPGSKRLTIYNKLVRDGMPAVISADGHRAAFRTLDEATFIHELKRKLAEEVGEYLESDDPEELADIGEVLLALVEVLGVDPATTGVQKREERGGFDKRLFLLFVERPELRDEEPA